MENMEKKLQEAKAASYKLALLKTKAKMKH